MAEINVAVSLNAASLIEVRPVTLDAEGNPTTYGVPMLIKLSDFSAWLGGGGLTLPAATTATAGVVKKAAVHADIVNNSGGTSGGSTIAAVTDVATANNAIATLAVNFNALQGVLRTAGVLS